MKTTLLILILLRCITVSAHIRISDFKQSFSDGAAADVRTSAADPNGQLCVILKLETKPTGWTFDAGLAGIIDTRYGDGIIWIYLPASARKLTVANIEYGVLRDWSFPVSLEPGRTYTMKPSYERPPQTSQAQRPARMSAPTTLSGASQSTSRRVTPPLPTMVTNAAPRYAAAPSERTFCDHFVDFYMGFSCYKVYQDYYSFDDACWFGFSYIWIGNRVGLYASLAFNADECFSILGGLTLRLTDPKAATMDWHLYGGAGLIDDCLGFDVGARFAWRSSYKLSRWDFGFGCQFSQGAIIPTVSVGLYIWGIPAVIGLGLVCGGGI